jgi:predicted membrane chloride channel (bestrophin family)
MNRQSEKRRSLMVNVLVTVAVVFAMKLVAHWLHWEVIPLNPLFIGIVVADVFLLAFLLHGVLCDYKESERLPGELAAAIEAFADEAVCLPKDKRSEALWLLDFSLGLAKAVSDWLLRNYVTFRQLRIVRLLGELNGHFAALEGAMSPVLIARLKQEQTNIRRIVTRIDTIRETSFIPSSYAITRVATSLLIAGLVLAEISPSPFFESLFLIGVITFLMRFLVLLIEDLDNPFGYSEPNSVEDVSLKPIDELIVRLEELAKEMNPGGENRVADSGNRITE